MPSLGGNGDDHTGLSDGIFRTRSRIKRREAYIPSTSNVVVCISVLVASHILAFKQGEKAEISRAAYVYKSRQRQASGLLTDISGRVASGNPAEDYIAKNCIKTTKYLTSVFGYDFWCDGYPVSLDPSGTIVAPAREGTEFLESYVPREREDKTPQGRPGISTLR